MTLCGSRGEQPRASRRRCGLLAGLAAQRPEGGICVLSRQRIVGSTNGSSTYLLSLCAALHADGHKLHLVCPSPSMFGRWPGLVLGHEMAVFSSVRIRGALRIGRVFIATDPTVLCRTIVGILGNLLARLGLHLRALNRPAPYAIGLPWQRRDLRYVARRAPTHAAGVLVDYAFLTEGIPHVQAAGPSAVVMHDLFSSRPAQFGPVGAEDSVAVVNVAAEMAMLSRADAVIAIQDAEAQAVRRHLPATPVLLAPMAIVPVATPQPGEAIELLFVGSNTSPNVDGLRWLLAEVWPAIRQTHPAAQLNVVGTVAQSVQTAPAGVAMLGRVADLAAFYARAAVVISPLRAGSGLKIKLIEALGYGKAVVATSTTLQGVEDIVRPAVDVADNAADFAAAVAVLLDDAALRRQRGATALAVAQAHFSAQTCYAPVTAFFARANDAPAAPHVRSSSLPIE